MNELNSYIFRNKGSFWICIHFNYKAVIIDNSNISESLSCLYIFEATYPFMWLVSKHQRVTLCYRCNTLAYFQENAKMAYKLLNSIPGLKPVMPAGAMYMMVGFP